MKVIIYGAGIAGTKLRRVAVYKEDENKVIAVITNNLEWSATTIAELYKHRWQIEIFFKLMKQNLQIKTFLGTSQNTCKSQIFIAMIVYLLLELVRCNISWTYHCFGHFVTLIRVCLTSIIGWNTLPLRSKLRCKKRNRRTSRPTKAKSPWFLGNFFIL